MERPWVLTEEGRRSRLGTELACVKCDAGAPRDDVAYVVLLENIPGVPTPAGVIHRHIAYLRSLDEQGALLLCGPFLDHAGGMVILRARDDAHARALAEADPFFTERVRTHTLRRWKLATRSNRYLSPA